MQQTAGAISLGEKLPILLTSAIKVAAPRTKLSDASARMAATIQALSCWMTLCPDTEFVLCDGSGFDARPNLRASPAIDERRLEVINFENDRAQVQVKGKGYGEGQIIKYALQNSSILKSAESFAKCTGKLWVANFQACRDAYNGNAGFSYFGFLSIIAVDTRFFIVNKTFFETHLLDSYSKCDDSNGRYLENVYFDSLRDKDRKSWLLSVYPRICGLSGTSGEAYRPDRLKEWGKTLAIQVVRRRK